MRTLILALTVPIALAVAAELHAQTRAVNSPVYFPVKGNHEHKNWYNWIPLPHLWIFTDHSDVIEDHVLPLEREWANASWSQTVVPSGNGDLSYHVDWKNVRVIVVDQYGEFGSASDRKLLKVPLLGRPLTWVLPKISEGNINAHGLRYVSGLLSAVRGDTIDHIFVVFHEPAFPQNRHQGNGLDYFEDDRDDLWAQMSAHPKVRAVLVGHTHIYSVFDKDGLRQIDVGGAGRTGTCPDVPQKLLTWLDVEIRSDRVTFSVWQSPWDYQFKSCFPTYHNRPNRLCDPPDVPDASFSIAKQWDISVPSDSPRFDATWTFAAISDSRDEYTPYRKVLESIDRERGVESTPSLDFLLAIGDIDPVKENYAIFREVLTQP